MKRLLLYVHFNKFNQFSSHVEYQLAQMRTLFSTVVFISNSQFSKEAEEHLQEENLIDAFIQRKNLGFDFAAWRDGMTHIGFSHLGEYDSVTLMNDTCFGPLWDMKEIYHRFEQDERVDFWGMTNYRATKAVPEHIQSYFLSFKQPVIVSQVFQDFWASVKDLTDVQEVIDHYETQVTTSFIGAGFRYQTVFDTVKEDTSGMAYPDFSYYNPTSIVNHRVPFIKVKTVDANQSIIPYILNDIEARSDYPIEKLVYHMSTITYPDLPYLLARKYLNAGEVVLPLTKKVAIHLHVFYLDLLQEFLTAFEQFSFPYTLFITTDEQKKVGVIERMLEESHLAARIIVTGNKGRDILPMLKLKEELRSYDYIGHFHTKKSKEADFWAGESWRKELIEMMIHPANTILSNMEQQKELGLVIADIPSFFRFNKIVDAHNEHHIAPIMNELWEKMKCEKSIDFETFNTFVMSYGTYVWFKYDALEPLFELDLTDQDVPSEPLPQNSILHAIERLLVYVAWDRQYDFRIAPNPMHLTPFIDSKLLNLRGDTLPNTYVNFDHLGGIRGALKYLFIGPARAMKYIIKRCLKKVKK